MADDGQARFDMSYVEDKTNVLESGPLPAGSFLQEKLDERTITAENVHGQKRKGGRKRVYATPGERMQRNREAQAAFRERRTAYIKQLEATISHLEKTLQDCQRSHDIAQDECLMLRYKNALLEHMLLEKGIDVAAELKGKDDKAPIRAIPCPKTRNTTSRTTLKRIRTQNPKSINTSKKSTQWQPTPMLASSPTASRVHNSTLQGRMISPHSAPEIQQGQHPQPPRRKVDEYPQLPPHPKMTLPTSSAIPHTENALSNHTGGGRSNAADPQSNPSLSPHQVHMQQLEQEYDADACGYIIEEQDANDYLIGPGPYPEPTDEQPASPRHAHLVGGQARSIMQPPMMPQLGDSWPSVSIPINQAFRTYDPWLVADPFGLTASMQFPTQF